jgi:hypothetical protein
MALTHSYRTLETGQLHAFCADLPESAGARLYRDMSALGLLDLGFPRSYDRPIAMSPRRAEWMAVRLCALGGIEDRLAALGATPFQVAALGPGPLRGARQAERHNLLAATTALDLMGRGHRVVGEAWSRLDHLFADPQLGHGGPDITAIRADGLRVCIELTASVSYIQGKIDRWRHALDSHPDARIHVVWLVAPRPGWSPAASLAGRMSAGMSVVEWGALDIDEIPCLSGPTWREPPSSGMGAVTQIAATFGLDAGTWRIPPPILDTLY